MFSWGIMCIDCEQINYVCNLTHCQGDFVTKSTTIGERLEQERKRLRLTQDQMADFVGIERARLSKYENGITIPRCDTLNTFKKVGVDVSYVLTGERSSLSATVLTFEEERLLASYRAATEKNKVVARTVVYALASLNEHEKDMVSEPLPHIHQAQNDDVSNSTHLTVHEESDVYEVKKAGKEDK